MQGRVTSRVTGEILPSDETGLRFSAFKGIFAVRTRHLLQARRRGGILPPVAQCYPSVLPSPSPRQSRVHCTERILDHPLKLQGKAHHLPIQLFSAHLCIRRHLPGAPAAAALKPGASRRLIPADPAHRTWFRSTDHGCAG